MDRVRDLIEATTKTVHDERWRILFKRQGDLWDEGIKAGTVLQDAPIDEPVDDDDDESPIVPNGEHLITVGGDYTAGKWGRFLRAPDLYFQIMERYKSRFIKLGELVEIGRGITSGCDAFFMPKDVTAFVLEHYDTEKEFRIAVGVSRKHVVSGDVRIIEDGAGTYHPIEPKYVSPVIHTLRDNRRAIVKEQALDQVVLLVKGPLSAIKGTHAYRYIKYGEETTYVSSKSRAVPVSQRSCCAAREPWFNLTPYVRPGFALWPLSHQYRHVIPANPKSLIANKRMMDIRSEDLSKSERDALVAILNSTFIGLTKTYFGRYTGTEGALGTDVLDVEMMEVPDPRGADDAITKRLTEAFKSLCKRDIGRMVEDAFIECHTYERARELTTRKMVLPDELRQTDRRKLDDAVFELLGVTNAKERSSLIDRLYEVTTKHFRDVRVMEIQKMEDRRTGTSTKFAIADHAADAWDAFDLPDLIPLAEWVATHASGDCEVINIPSERPVFINRDAMFDNETVYFGKTKHLHMVCQSCGEAELVARMATLGVTGEVSVPKTDQAATKLLSKLNIRHEKAVTRLRELAASRSADSDTQEQLANLLERWFVLGKPNGKNRPTAPRN